MENFFLDNKDIQFHLDHPLVKKVVDLKENNYEDSLTNDMAPASYEDAVDNYRKVMDVMGQICAETLDKNAESVDVEGPEVVNNRVVYARGTQENHDKLIQAGMYGMSLPREYDGLNFPLVAFTMSCELVGRADAGFGNIWGLQDCAETLHEFASDEQNHRFLPRVSKGETCAMDLTEPDAGSDLQAVQLKATWSEERGMWLLNGVKRFITNGDADISLVLARSEEGTSDARGLSLFVYDKQHDAVKVRRIEHKLGIIGSPTCELVFTDAPAELVGDRKMGLIRYVMALMNAARLGIGAQSVGLMEAAYREGLKYAKERKQFGKPIIEFAPVYEMLTNMNAKILASRAMLYETARFVDVYKTYYHISKKRKLEREERDEMKEYTKLADVFTPLLKLFSSEYANEVAYDSLQIHGGSGYMKDYPIQRYVRDARITNIYEGTSQLQVVAAIRGVVTGVFENSILKYESAALPADVEPLLKRLIAMREEYQAAVAHVTGKEDGQYLDFQARRLVEMAGYIIHGHLLLINVAKSQAATTDCAHKVGCGTEEYLRAAKSYIMRGESICKGHLAYIMATTTDDVAIYKSVSEQ